MRARLAGLIPILALAASACRAPATAPDGGAGPDLQTALAEPAWLDAKILVLGDGATNKDCRTGICQHNENTDLIAWHGATWLVHRTAQSQILGPNSSLLIYRSSDGGASFTETARILAPTRPEPRDLRDPHFFIVGDVLHLKALTRLPVISSRDSSVDTIAVDAHTSDGTTWTDLAPIGPTGWSFWRIQQRAGVYYTAAYADGDAKVALFTSQDGVKWSQGADVYAVSADTPLETELTFFPSGNLLALVRTDGTDAELLGDQGRLRTRICRATPPYAKFSCDGVFDGQRLDGPLSFFHRDRLFVVARKHLQGTGRKRTALFEITATPPGMLDGGMLAIKEWGELPSAGDTAYAGVAAIDADRVLLSWYASALYRDENWSIGMLDATDIWQGVLDFTKLP